MVVAVWSVKGGVGVSSVAALLAIGQVERAEEVLLVDLCGDAPALLGIDDAVDGPGVVDWCAIDARCADALERLEIEAGPGLRLLPRGAGEFSGGAGALMSVLKRSPYTVIIDCGVVTPTNTFCSDVVADAQPSLLIARECYLNLRALRETTLVPTGVVVLKEPRRVLGRADVEAVAMAPVIAEVAIDSSVARSIDSGLLTARLSRPLIRAMGKVLDRAA